MPLYEYKSDDGVVIEVFKHASGKIPNSVTRKGVKYHRIYSLPSVIVDNNKPKTIGSLAEQNTKEKIKRGEINPPKKKERPWFRDSDKPNLKLASMSQKQKTDFLMTGKQP